MTTHSSLSRKNRRGGKENNFVELANARLKNQKTVMERIRKDGVCPFCPEHIRKYHKNPILKEGNFWLATANAFPYDGARMQLLFIYKKHATRLSETEKGAWPELIKHVLWAESKFKLRGSSLLLRSGETDFTGATVSHLHAHMIAGGRKPSGKTKPDPDNFITTVLGYKKK